jgi:hypothetical protein
MKNFFKYKLAIFSLLFLSPLLTFAQSINGRTQLSDFGARILSFINGVLVPAAFAVVLLLFVYGIFRLFILGDSNDDDKKKARQFVIWAVISLVVVVSIWGITNLIARGLGFDDPDAIDIIIPTAGKVSTSN